MNLGRYEVVRELGKGAMGIVYLAKDPLIGRLVALKTIRLASSGDDEETREFQERFIREAQAAGILNHPSIVTVFDIGQDEHKEMSFIAMEYVEGPNLKEIINQGRELNFVEIAEVIAQVADALDFAHSKGIVHRDVKPANIIICGDSRAKITDFGIAKIASSVANLTTTGQFLGTPNYMAPEQVRGTPVDGRTDLFSLGVVLYECLTKRKPFAGESLTTISYKIVHENYAPLREVDDAIPSGFERVISKCLAKNPQHRYQRGLELAAELRGLSSIKPQVRNPLLIEETVVGRPSERLPTVEMPFPEIVQDVAEASPVAAEQVGVATGRSPERLSGSRPAVPIRKPRKPIDPRAILKMSIPWALAAIVIGASLLLAASKGYSIVRQRVETPAVDTAKESLVARQRELRLKGLAELKRNDAETAYQTFTELRKIAPQSPYVAEMTRKLGQIHRMQLSRKERFAQAKQRVAEGKALYEKGEFAAAIPIFEEAFHLDPNLDEAVAYLRLSREGLRQKKR